MGNPKSQAMPWSILRRWIYLGCHIYIYIIYIYIYIYILYNILWHLFFRSWIRHFPSQSRRWLDAIRSALGPVVYKGPPVRLSIGPESEHQRIKCVWLGDWSRSKTWNMNMNLYVYIYMYVMYVCLSVCMCMYVCMYNIYIWLYDKYTYYKYYMFESMGQENV